MSTVVKLGTIEIRVYPSNRLPPHFHISTSYGEAKMNIVDLTLAKGWLSHVDFNRVLDWARENKGLIEDEWKRENG